MTTMPVTERPETPDGHKHHFNCCAAPHVVEDLENRQKYCESCGYDWTKRLK